MKTPQKAQASVQPSLYVSVGWLGGTFLLIMEKAISSQDLAPHTPEEGGFAFFFYDLAWHQACHLCDLAINAWLFAVVVGC